MDPRRISSRSRLRLNVSIAVVAAAVLVGIVPAAVSADSFCGQARARAFTLPGPASFSEPGLHRFEWHEIYLDQDGNPVEEYILNQIETVPGTQLYTGSVLLRLFSVWGFEADGDVDTDVQAIHPDQAVRFFASVGYFKDDPFAGENEAWVRWETASGWTDWVSVPRGPETAFCQSIRADIFHGAFGWAN